MSVQAGKGCFIRQFTTTTGGAGARRFPTTGLSLVNKPSRGIVSIDGNRIIYKSTAGPGSDQFTYRAVNRIAGKTGATFLYRVNVSVY
jgi:hypothetical protein